MTREQMIDEAVRRVAKALPTARPAWRWIEGPSSDRSLAQYCRGVGADYVTAIRAEFRRIASGAA